MLGHVQVLRVKELLMELKNTITNTKRVSTKYPYLVQDAKGYLYYSLDIPKFMSYPEKPGDKIFIRGKHVTLEELERILQDDS
jgi:hypothetical protein